MIRANPLRSFLGGGGRSENCYQEVNKKVNLVENINSNGWMNRG